MNFGITVNFRGRSLKDSCVNALCQTEHIDRAHHAGFDGFHGIILIMNGRSRTREIVNLVNFEKNRFGYIVPNQFKKMIVHQMQNIFLSAREKIVETNNFVAFIQKSFAKMRTDKACAAGDDDCFFKRNHCKLLALVKK